VVTISVVGARGVGSGSGAVLRAGGYILTNDHVISAASGGGAVSVIYNDGSTSTAQVVGRDPDTDLAVIKAADGAPNSPVIAIGSSREVVTGQPVVALGAPLGLSGTVTSGIVSALDRELTVPGADGQRAQLVGAIQTDAAINPGNSGGPLVDCSSRMVGVNTAIATVPNATGTAGGGSVGLGFAIPVDLAVRLAGELIAQGRVNHPTFGFEGHVLSPEAAAATGLPQGVLVRRVVAGGPAADAGLRAGDVIVEIDGRPARSADAVVLAVLSRSAGDVVDLTYVRDGVTKKTEVTLGDSAR
jgi:putative serine protease PepD